jgi:hypothetical protein
VSTTIKTPAQMADRLLLLLLPLQLSVLMLCILLLQFLLPVFDMAAVTAATVLQ